MPSNTVITVGQGPVAFLVKLVTYVANLVELLLGLRFFLRFAGANPANIFAGYTYGLSGVFLTPFRGILPGMNVQGSVVEWSTLFAMAIYAILAYLLIQLVLMLLPHEEIIEREHVDIDTLTHV